MAKTMEEYGPISVDWFNQRRVERLETPPATEGGPTWILYFEGGGELHNFEPEVPTPKNVVGAALTRTIFDGTNKVTRLQFGLEEITLNPMKYAISDPNYTKGVLVYAQLSMANKLPPEPEGRTAEGPDDEWKKGQEEGGVTAKESKVARSSKAKRGRKK